MSHLVKLKNYIILFLIIIILTPNFSYSRVKISGNNITTENIDLKKKYIPFNIKAPKKINIDKTHLNKTIDFIDAVHFERRTGIGNPINRVKRYIGLTRKQAIEILISELVNKDDKFVYPEWIENTIPINFMEDAMDSSMMYKSCYRSTLLKQSKSLEKSWAQEIILTENPQFERLVLFWHNHFVSGFVGSYERSHAYSKHIKILRENSKGNLKVFLRNILNDPSMISYLNNDENFIGNVNENLGRELLELFSLGEGNYDEVDVKNMAKVLTGHSINTVNLEYKFINGAATSKDWIILGSPIRSLKDVVDLLVNHPKLSELLSKKFYREYISLDLPSKNNLDYLIYEFYINNFEISSLLKATLELPEFWDKKNRLGLVKSPIDLIFGTARTLEFTGSQGHNIQNLFNYTDEIGQNILNPPNVAGWDGGLSWLDGNSIETRNQIMDKLYSPVFFNKTIDYNKNFESSQKANLTTKQFIDEYNQNLSFKMKNVKKDQLFAETMLLEAHRRFLKSDHPEIHIIIRNMKLNNREWKGYRFSIGVDKKYLKDNFMRIESNKCFPECLEKFSRGFSKKSGSQVVKFPYPNPKGHRNYIALSNDDKLLVNRLFEITSVVLSNTKIFDHLKKGGKENTEIWLNWLEDRHNEFIPIKIKQKPLYPRFILMNDSANKSKSSCSHIGRYSNLFNFRTELKDKIKFNFDDFKTKAKNQGLNFDKLLVSEFDIPGSNDNPHLAILNEAYQLK